MYKLKKKMPIITFSITSSYYKLIFGFLVLIILSCAITRGIAQTQQTGIGDVTGLALPRFVSTKSNKINVRRGPGTDYLIDWIYQRKGLPLKVTAEFDIWRRVEDFEGEGGWVHSRLLSGNRFVVFLPLSSSLKSKANLKATDVAVIKRGVIAELLDAKNNWCKISTDGYTGWVLKEHLWGINSNEFLDK